jgi:hypothetical protein
MTKSSNTGPPLRPAGLVAVVTVALFVSSWSLFLLSLVYGYHLQQQFGPIPDVVDALKCGEYVGLRTLPWRASVVALDFLAAVAGTIPTRRGWPQAFQLSAAILAVPSACLHGLALMVTGWLTI